MDLFKLIGSIIIKKDDADAAISDVSAKGQNLASTIGTAFQNVGNKMTSVGKAIAPVSLAVGGALTASTKSASDFQNSIAKVSTLVDTSKVSVSDLSKTFLNLSNETGKSATELAEAGYQALSASVPIENLGEFTRTATNLAKVGFTQASTAVDVMTTAINAYGLESSDANKIANNLVKTQNLGKTTVDELASSMGKIIPTASSMNVNLDNLSAVYVSLTKQGIATAEATTYANSMFNELGDSGTDVGGILKEKTGKSFQELMASGYSVADCLKVLQDYAKDTGTNFNELWGSSEAGKAAIALLNGGVDEFNGTIETMADKTDVVAEGLEKLNTPSAKAQKALNRIKNSGIELGTSFITALTPTIDKVCSLVERATTWFNNLDPKMKTIIATIMAVVAAASPALMIGGRLISGIGTAIGVLSKLWTVLMANPIVLIVGLIAGLVAGFIYLWNTSDSFRNFWINLWETIKTVVSTVVTAVVEFFTNLWNRITEIFNSIASVVSTVWETIKNVVQVAIMFIVEIITLAFNLITLPWRFIWENCKDIIITIWNAIKTAVSTAINAIQTVITTVFNAVKTFITTVMNAIRTVFSTVWNAIKSVITTVLNAIRAVVTSVWNAIKSVVTSVVNAIKSVITSVFNAIKSVITSILNSVKSTFSSVWNSIKSVVSSAVNGVKSTISSGLNAAKSTVSSVLSAISSKFSSIFNTVKSTVQNAINRVKSIMNFSWHLPHLSLPHISISGSFSINPPSVPHFGISWYKKAMDNPMLFTEPTLFDLNPTTGVGKVAGEAGDEMMYGHDNLMNDIATVVAEKNRDLTDKFDRLITILVEFFPELMTAMNRQIVLDSGAVVGELAPAMDAELGRIIDHKGRGN